MSNGADGNREVYAWSTLAVATAVLLVVASRAASFPGEVAAGSYSFWE